MSQSDLHKQLFHWQGRNDPEEGKDGRRVHHIVQHKTASELSNHDVQGISILGFATDAGVARNKGRIGAKKAPDLIRRALANLAWHKNTPLYDLGTVVCEDDLLEESQARCAKTIAQALPHTSVIVLGGGHEIAWASFSGLAEYFKTHHPEKKPKIGIVNFDAHFNLRAFDSSHADSKPSSGTPFNQIHHFCQ